MKKRPNILFLMSDEHRADVCGFGGNNVVRTPHLDALAKDAVVFDNAYTPSPICVPARQCMAAGQLPHTCGCEGWVDLPPGHMTFARQLSFYGYHTACCGKLHHDGYDQMQGWLQRPAGDLSIRVVEGAVQEELDRYKRPFADYKWSDAKEIRRAGMGESPCVAVDKEWTNSALRFIEEYFNNACYDRERGHQPLLLMVSLLQPHYPYMTDAEKFGYYLNRVEPYLHQTPSTHPFLQQRQVRPGEDASQRELRRATAAYYGMIETIDGHFGSVLRQLEYVGQNSDEWIILYTSDHGEMLGEHGIWEKQKFYEGSARVPLFIRWPKGFDGGKRVEQNVSLCDLFATLCELTGVPLPAQTLDSRSLAPLLRGESKDWDNEVISQFQTANVMVKRDHLKYQYYGEKLPEVLFDLQKDPGETVNFINDPAYKEAAAHLRARCMEYLSAPVPG